MCLPDLLTPYVPTWPSDPLCSYPQPEMGRPAAPQGTTTVRLITEGDSFYFLWFVVILCCEALCKPAFEIWLCKVTYKPLNVAPCSTNADDQVSVTGSWLVLIQTLECSAWEMTIHGQDSFTERSAWEMTIHMIHFLSFQHGKWWYVGFQSHSAQVPIYVHATMMHMGQWHYCHENAQSDS